mgnify:FL=1
MSKENFEKQIRKRMEQLDEINEHGIFKELKGTVTDFNYDTKSLTMTFEATKFHENAFGIMFGGSLAGMFDIAFGTLTAGLGDYSVAPTVQLSTTFFKRNTNRSNRKNRGRSSVHRKNDHEFCWKSLCRRRTRRKRQRDIYDTAAI